MIIERNGLTGNYYEFAYLEQWMESHGFIRWQWEYSRATYDYKIDTQQGEYFLRTNARVTKGRLEQPQAELVLEDVYIGKATYPLGLDYETEIPQEVLKRALKKLDDLKHSDGRGPTSSEVSFNTRTVREVMGKDFVTIEPTARLDEAIRLMKERETGYIIVIAEQRIQGILTDRDVLIRGVTNDFSANRVTDISSHEVITVAPEELIEAALQTMIDHRVRRLPVVEDGLLIGLLSLDDLITRQASSQQKSSQERVLV